MLAVVAIATGGCDDNIRTTDSGASGVAVVTLAPPLCGPLAPAQAVADVLGASGREVPTLQPQAAAPSAVGEPTPDAGGGAGTILYPAGGCWPFPTAECATLARIAECESGNGRDPATYDLDAENGGWLQLNKATWADFFAREYGWTWERVVRDDDLNRVAAYVIWQRSGWSAWACW